MKLKTLFTTVVALCLAVTAFAASPSGTLPVLYINTDGGQAITSKEDYVKASYWLDPKGTGMDAFGTQEKPLTMQIRGRGNYTWSGFAKKPYRVKLDKKQKLLGMKSSKHWALLAHADDNKGFMRNLTGFKLAKLIGMAWTPSDQPCEVVLNGEYIGLYFLTETIRVDKDRVNINDLDSDVADWIDEQAADTINPRPGLTYNDYVREVGAPDLNGGWLVEIDNYEDVNQVKVPSKQQHSNWNGKIMVTIDSPEDFITQAHKDWLYNEIKSIDEMIFDSNKNDCKWAEKIDLTDLAKFFIVNQLMGNYESFHGSCKMYRDRGEGEKWHFGPVWDFGSSFQDSWNYSKPIWESEYIQHWIEEMYKFPEFQKEVARVYTEFVNSGALVELKAYQNAYADRIAQAAKNDQQRWSSNGYGNADVKGKLSEVQGKLSSSVSYADNHYTESNSGSGSTVTAPDKAMYLRGDVSGWNAQDTYKLTEVKAGSMVYAVKVSNLYGSFKIGSDDWKGYVNYGGVSNIPLNTRTKLTYNSDGNCSVSGGSVNNVTVTFDWNTKEIIIGDPIVVPDPIITPDPEPQDEYYALHGSITPKGSDNEWKSVKLKKNDENGCWEYTGEFKAGEFFIKVCDENYEQTMINGRSWIGGSATITEANKAYTFSGNNSSKSTLATGEYTVSFNPAASTITFTLISLTELDPEPTPTPTDGNYYAVHGQIVPGNSSWNTEHLTKQPDGTWTYTGTFKSGEFGIQICDENYNQYADNSGKANWIGGGAQVSEANKAYSMNGSSNSKSTLAEGTYTFTFDPSAMTVKFVSNSTPTPTPTDGSYYAIHGQIVPGSSTWNTQALTIQTDGTWAYTGTLKSGEFGVRKCDKNGNQTAWIGGGAQVTETNKTYSMAGSGNSSSTLGEATYTFIYDPEANTVKFAGSATPTPETKEYYAIHGQIIPGEKSGDWYSKNLTEQPDGTWTYTGTIQLGEFGIKVCDKNYKQTSINGRDWIGGNIEISVANKDYNFSSGSNSKNLKLTGEFTISYDPAAGTIKFIPYVNPNLVRRVYFVNNHITRNASFWDNPHIYTENPEKHGSFPGSPMTITTVNAVPCYVSEWTVDNEDQHKTGDAFFVISNGQSGANLEQTTSLAYEPDGVYTTDGYYTNVSGIADIIVDAEGAAEFFTLQGVRVDAENLTPGIYIRRAGLSTTKVVIR